ncbi:MAG TPA: hypothetical protein DC013_08440 [Ruminococcaceae bacterium]|nr:hypothetical protein [Oscillospiraceae bacterium]
MRVKEGPAPRHTILLIINQNCEKIKIFPKITPKGASSGECSFGGGKRKRAARSGLFGSLNVFISRE